MYHRRPGTTTINSSLEQLSGDAICIHNSAELCLIAVGPMEVPFSFRVFPCSIVRMRCGKEAKLVI